MSEDENASADSKLFGVIGENFLKRFHQSERKVISYVKDVEETPNGMIAHITNEHGEPNIKFLDEDDIPLYQTGEYIEQTVSGQRVKGTRKLNLNQSDKEELSKKFKSIGESG